MLGLTFGGIQFGIFTPNEAASFSTLFVVCYAIVRRKLTGKAVLYALKNTLAVSGMALAIIAGAGMFDVFIVMSKIPQELAEWLVSLQMSSTLLIIIIMVLYTILGINMNGITILMLTIPFLLPVLQAYNINLVWFGVLAILQCELANLSPPVGMNLFVIAAMAKPHGITMGTVFRGAAPFCVTCLLLNILLIIFPQIALFLVGKMQQF